MNWLAEIFQSTSDQARLATTLIAGTIAIAVVLLTQLFNSKRARKDKQIQKIEEMYSILIEMQTLKNSMRNEIIEKFSLNEERRRLFELNDKFETVSATAFMLSGLYFQVLSENISKLRT